MAWLGPVRPPLDDPERARESNVGQILGTVTVFHFLALTSVGLRLYVRLGLVKSAGRDDWTMLAAALCAFGGWVLFVFQSFHGLGHHQDTLSEKDEMYLNLSVFWQVIISSATSMALLKVSIALNLLRLTQSQGRWYSWALWGSIVFVSVYSFLGMFPFFLHCRPMAAHWDRHIPGGKCYNIKLYVAFGLVNSSLNIFTDVVFAILPIPLIWSLHIKRRVRLYLVGVLSLGYMAVAFGITKTVYQLTFSKEKDSTFHQWIPFWAFLQLNVGIIAACAPSLKPLVNKALRLGDYATYAYDYGPNYSNSRSRPRASQLSPLGNGRYSRADDFELADRRAMAAATVDSKVTTTPETFYKGSSGSEEYILSQGQAKGRIMRTTEVIVS